MLDPRASVVEWIRTNAVANTKATYVTYQKQYKEYTRAEGLDPSKGEALCPGPCAPSCATASRSAR